MVIGQLSEGAACGQVRFDRESDGAWAISYSLAPEFRGLRLGRRLLEAALLRLEQRELHTCVIARVKPENVASKRIFQGLGFELVDSDGLLVYRRAANGALCS